MLRQDNLEDGKALLNDCQKALLARASRYGMTAQMLQAWKPERDAQINRIPIQQEQSQKVTAQRALATPKRAAIVDMFEQEHADAVMHLISKHGMSAEDAIAEISELNPEEAKFLQQYYDGRVITGSVLRDNDASINCMDHDWYRAAFSFLVDKKNYDKAIALEELRDLTPDQILMLIDLYDYGIRGNTIRNLEQSDRNHLVFDNYGDNAKYRAYFKKVFKAENKQAQDQSTALKNTVAICAFNVEDNEATDWLGRRVNPKIDFLSRHRFQGLYAQDLPEHFTSEHWKTFTYLRFKGLSPQFAMAELKFLDSHRARLLRDYYKFGVRSDQLKRLASQDAAALQHRVGHLAALSGGVVGALDQLMDLEEWQGRLLEMNISNGLRRQHIDAFMKDHEGFEGFSDAKLSAIELLLGEGEAINPNRIGEVLEKAFEMSEEQAANIIYNNMREPQPKIMK